MNKKRHGKIASYKCVYMLLCLEKLAAYLFIDYYRIVRNKMNVSTDKNFEFNIVVVS